MSIRNRSPFSRIADAAMVIILGLASLICLYPILYVVFASFSDSALLEGYNGFLYRPLGFRSMHTAQSSMTVKYGAAMQIRFCMS